jgi:ribosomal protein L11 methyltransferase
VSGISLADPAATYLCLELQVTAGAEDFFLAEMGSLGTLGLEKLGTGSAGCITYLAYFRLPAAVAVHMFAAGDRPVRGVELVGSREVPGQDWLVRYRETAQPFALGKRWWIDPRDPGASQMQSPEGRKLLRIPAWTAFGTGSHVSTALLVRLLEDLAFDSPRVMDLGTGTGILSIIALELGAAEVIALDIDPVAAFIARQICRLNGTLPRIVAGEVQALQCEVHGGIFDLVLANVIPSRLRSGLPRMVEAVKSGGAVLLSGILVDQEFDYLKELAALGLRRKSRLEAQGWVALCMEKAPR